MKLKHVSALFIICLLLTALPAGAFAESAVYEPVTVKTVKENAVNELGGVLVKFGAGKLQKNDFVVLRLPSGFIWTTKDLDANQFTAARSVQSSEQWSTVTYDFDSVRYGTKNYVLVPRRDSGNENAFYTTNKPAFSFTSLNEREVRLEIIEELAPQKECYFYLYPERVFVPWGYGGDIGITVDIIDTTPDNQDAALGGDADVSLQCPDAGKVYAGVKGQKIGAIILTESAARQVIHDTGLTLKLPPGARWEKVSESSNNNLKAAGSISDDGRTAEFKFTGPSRAPASLRLEDMEVFVDPELTGDLKVQVGGTAGFGGELRVADIVRPDVAFVIGQDTFLLNGKEEKMDTAPYVKNDRAYLPVRYVATSLDIADGDIVWYPAEGSVVILRGSNSIKFVVGSKEMLINGKPVVMDVAPEIVAPGRLMLPLRWAAQAFGANIDWNETTKTIIIKK